MKVNWPTLLLVGLPGCGKSEAWSHLIHELDYPALKLIEGHVTPKAPLLACERLIRSPVDLASLRDCPGGLVVVWFDVPLRLRGRRISVSPRDVAPGFDPASIRGLCHQLINNIGTYPEFWECLGELKGRCGSGDYKALSPGMRAEDLGRRPSDTVVLNDGAVSNYL